MQRKAEVTQSDPRAFQDYLDQKAQETPRALPEAPARKSRRPRNSTVGNLLKVVAGTAVVGEAAAATYAWVTGSASDQGARNSGARYAEAQRDHVERTLINSKSDIGGRGLGKWIALLPTKLGGGTYALDLNSNRVSVVDLVLDLRRLQPDLPSPVRVSERRSVSFLRVRRRAREAARTA